jgi:uncharacterized membrane protein HdeD (DUF308 family)
MTTDTVTTQSEQSSNPWWLVLIEGSAAIIMGIFLLANPGSTLAVLVRLLGICFFAAGILSITVIFIDKTALDWKLFAGIIGILAGFMIIEYPHRYIIIKCVAQSRNYEIQNIFRTKRRSAQLHYNISER